MNQYNASNRQQAGQFNAQLQQQSNQFNADLANQNRDRQLAAIGLSGDLTSTDQANQRANLGLLSDISGQQWQIDQYNQLSPLSYLSAYGGLLDPSLLSLFIGQQGQGTETTQGTQTTRQSGGLLGDLLSVGSSIGSAAIMASDRRLKRDIEPIGHLPSGLGVYSYRYVWDAVKHIGVMADEVARLVPEALGPIVGGYATVDYGKVR